MITQIQQVIKVFSQERSCQEKIKKIQIDSQCQNIVYLEVYLHNSQKKKIRVFSEQKNTISSMDNIIEIKLMSKHHYQQAQQRINCDISNFKDALHNFMVEIFCNNGGKFDKKDAKTKASSPITYPENIMFNQRVQHLNKSNQNLLKILRKQIARIAENYGQQMVDFQKVKQLVTSSQTDSEVIAEMLDIQCYQSAISQYLNGGEFNRDVMYFSQAKSNQKMAMILSTASLIIFCNSILK